MAGVKKKGRSVKKASASQGRRRKVAKARTRTAAKGPARKAAKKQTRKPVKGPGGKAAKGPTRKPVTGSARKAAPPPPMPRSIIRIRDLDPQRKCGAGTSVERLVRVDEMIDRRLEAHLVFLDRHGWYCEHGRSCHAVGHARKHRE